MKKFLLPLVVAVFSLASCADYTDDFNTINNRLDALEQSVPTIEEQIESINAQLTSLKATDEAIKKQISELEKSNNATATEIADLKKKDSALEKSIGDLQKYVDTQIANAKSEAAAAYATVEQYNTIVAQLGALQSSISKLGEELTAKIPYTIIPPKILSVLRLILPILITPLLYEISKPYKSTISRSATNTFASFIKNLCFSVESSLQFEIKVKSTILLFA